MSTTVKAENLTVVDCLDRKSHAAEKARKTIFLLTVAYLHDLAYFPLHKIKFLRLFYFFVFKKLSLVRPSDRFLWFELTFNYDRV